MGHLAIVGFLIIHKDELKGLKHRFKALTWASFFVPMILMINEKTEHSCYAPLQKGTYLIYVLLSFLVFTAYKCFYLFFHNVDVP